MARPKGSKNKRTVEGEVYARDVLVQDESELVREVPGDLESPVLEDKAAEARANPVLRRLRAQARNGVGNRDGMLPPAVVVQLADRCWGKVKDTVAMEVNARKAFEGESDEALAKRAADLAGQLGLPVDPDLHKPLKPGEGN